MCTLLLAGCAYQPIEPTPDAIRASIAPGDTVRVRTLSGEDRTFRVTDVESDRLSGETEEVAYGQIARLEKRETNNPVLWTVLGVAAVGLAASGSSGSSGY